MTSDRRGWRRIALGEVCHKIGSGATPRGGEDAYTPTGVALIRSKNVHDLSFSADGLARIPDKAADALRGVSVEAGDVLLNITGQSVARCCRAPQAILPARVNQHVAIVRPDPKELDSRFLQYALVVNKPRLLALASAGATREALTKAMISELEIEAPEITEQRRLSTVLGSLEEKIESNRRLVKTLEEIATVLFKARFIEFLDCDDLVESEIGPIPQGWSNTPVGDLARYVNGKAFTKFGNGQGRMVIRIAELRSGPGKSTVYSDHETEPDFMAAPGDILFAWSGSLDVYRWIRPEALINQHIFKVIPKGYPDWFVFHALKHVMPHFQAIAADKATTMGHIKRADLHAFSVATPPASALRKHNAVFAPLFERAFAAGREAETLTRVRDQLLPRLISGQIRIPPDEQLAPKVA